MSLIVQSAVIADRVRRSFHSDLSKHSSELLSYLLVIEVECGSDFGVKGSTC